MVLPEPYKGANELVSKHFFSFFFGFPVKDNPMNKNTGWNYLGLAWIHVGKYANMNPSQIQVILPDFA